MSDLLQKSHTGHMLEWSAIYKPTSSFFFDKDMQSNMESRACCPTPASLCTYGINNVKIINLKKDKGTCTYVAYKYICIIFYQLVFSYCCWMEK